MGSCAVRCIVTCGARGKGRCGIMYCIVTCGARDKNQLRPNPTPPRAPHCTANCPLGAPMGGNQQEHGWALFDIHVPNCICILAGPLLPALLMATTETV